ncbi:MAG: putative peptidoglycan biosynthesis protein MviN [Actinomycetota bacterium]
MSEVNDSSVMRNSSLMAVGTITSRITGVLRDVAMTAALGFFLVSDAFSLGNTLPNIVYLLLIGGALNSVFVPQLVRHIESDSDGGKAFSDRLLSLTGVALLAISALSVALAPFLISIYTSSDTPRDQYELAVAFARLCLPQIFFYGAYTMLQQVLNARGKFAAAFFAPVANNLVAIAVFVSFILIAKPDESNLVSLSNNEVLLLGLGSTAGVAVQALILVPLLFKTGYRFNWRSDWKNADLGKSASLAKWTIALIVLNQVAYSIVTRFVTEANLITSSTGGTPTGLTTYQKANLIFILPHSVITISLVTALLPSLSKIAHKQDFKALGAEVVKSVRVVLVLLIPIAGLLATTANEITTLLFGNGVAGIAAANATGTVAACFALGLPSFSIIYLINRAWYAMENTKTPFVISIYINVLALAISIPLFNMATDELKVAMFGVGYTITYLWVGAYSWIRLRKDLGYLPAGSVSVILVRVLIAAIPAVFFAYFFREYGLYAVVDGQLGVLLGLIATWGFGLLSYALIAIYLRVSELQALKELVIRKLRGSQVAQ